MFRLEDSHLQTPTTFLLPDALPTLGSHSVYICGIHFSLNFLKRFLIIECVIYRLCLNIKTLKFFLNSALMFTGYSTVSSVVVLWLMLEYFYFSYLIRTVVFINRHHSLDCCRVLLGKTSLQILLLWRISLFCPLFFHSSWSDLFHNVDVSAFCWVLTLFWHFVLYCFCSRCYEHCAGSWVTFLESLN